MSTHRWRLGAHPLPLLTRSSLARPPRAGMMVLALLGIAACGVTACGDGAPTSTPSDPPPGSPPVSSYRGVLTFSTPGSGDPFAPTTVQELDLATGQLVVKLNGLDATRAPSGETAFIQRLAGGHHADHGIVVADARGVAGAPLFVCRGFNWITSRGCATPKLAPGAALVAFTSVGGGGSLCKNNYDLYWGPFVVVTDRRGTEVVRFEGFHDPEWLPDGRLLMMGSACRNAGVWVSDAALRQAGRVDGGRVATPGGAPAVSPDGQRLAFVWNNQLWALSLAGPPELTQLTQLPKAVTSAAWSPDGRALATLLFDVTMPVRSLALFRPGDERSLEFREVPVYPYGPLSWR